MLPLVGNPRPGLLVSVRSVAEAEAALAGGAAIIDVKEPQRGSLGKADDAVITAVVERVAGRVPVSAALGELTEGHFPPSALEGQLAFLKWGLTGCSLHVDWRQELVRLRHISAAQVVVVGYADWQKANAPPLEEVCAFAWQRPGNVLLVDTFTKRAGSTLFDWLTPKQISHLSRVCRDSGVCLALAGSLGKREIQQLLSVAPTWFAVRGAACERQDRHGTVGIAKVQDLVALLE